MKAAEEKSAERSHPFLIGVSLYDTPRVLYSFDQDRVVVGRGDDVDLQVMHAAVSRHQLTIERIVPPIGAPRFRIVPTASKNPVYLNGAPAIAEAIAYGDVVAVGETRLTLVRPSIASGGRLGPKRIAVGVLGLLAVATLILFSLDGTSEKSADPVVNEKLFAHLPDVSCADTRQCVERARVAYAHGKTYAKQGASVMGNWYRATIEFYRAIGFERLSGAPVSGLEDAREQMRIAAVAAETVFNDLQFRLSRELKNNDAQALRKTIGALEAMVPDEEHPIRVKLAEYLRAHPLPARPIIKEEK